MAKSFIIGVVAALTLGVLLWIVIIDPAAKETTKKISNRVHPRSEERVAPPNTDSSVEEQPRLVADPPTVAPPQPPVEPEPLEEPPPPVDPPHTYPLTYVVKAGDTLIRLARSHYRDPAMYKIIAAENHLKNPDVIQAGTKLRLPDPARKTELLARYNQMMYGERVAVYRVQPGDTLDRVIRLFCEKPDNGDEYHAFEKAILQLNRLQSDEAIAIGHWLLMPGSSNAHTRAPEESMFWAWHRTVVTGDSFYSLSGGVDTGEQLIRQINGLSATATLEPGQQLYLPDWTTVDSRSLSPKTGVATGR